ncbi:hypothetical protein EDEG_03539 [Edhazardia aedis USNM 41457]|uniref:Uncharacterized protein n=1 Tax=Edhazardia aedis (strain USNM 41457) TaxID=1003232 RepID=J9D366_EDHAE|nr:hypothetical protein EDEG_03539 [Edhazardia aedis USNM 41457]|eukprot:EJW02014.1 hypothetical protein EDEG_03539 [Edhazardia aedis USNM 41457]
MGLAMLKIGIFVLVFIAIVFLVTIGLMIFYKPFTKDPLLNVNRTNESTGIKYAVSNRFKNKSIKPSVKKNFKQSINHKIESNEEYLLDDILIDSIDTEEIEESYKFVKKVNSDISDVYFVGDCVDSKEFESAQEGFDNDFMEKNGKKEKFHNTLVDNNKYDIDQINSSATILLGIQNKQNRINNVSEKQIEPTNFHVESVNVNIDNMNQSVESHQETKKIKGTKIDDVLVDSIDCMKTVKIGKSNETTVSKHNDILKGNNTEYIDYSSNYESAFEELDDNTEKNEKIKIIYQKKM